MARVTPIGANDFDTRRFNKNEHKWFRDVSRRLVRLDPIAVLETVTFTVETFDTVAVADAPAQGGAYVQADVQAIADLANANKAALNDHAAKLDSQAQQIAALAETVNQLTAAVGDTPV